MKKVVICLIVILIIAILGVGGWFLFDNLQKEKSRTNELESKVAAMESKNENNNSNETKNEENENKSNLNESKNEKTKENSTQTYDSLKGTYESQKINMNEGTNSEPVYMEIFSRSCRISCSVCFVSSCSTAAILSSPSTLARKGAYWFKILTVSPV